MAFTYREGLGRPLTYQEMDDNLEYVEQLAQHSEAMSDSAGISAAQATAAAGLAEGHEQSAQIYAAAAQSAAGVPSLAGNAGKVLGVASGEQGVEWKQLGTAATRDVGTSSGDLMEVGAFGLGSSGVSIADYNNAPEGAMFLYAPSGSTPNRPGGASSYAIQMDSKAGYAHQIGAGLAENELSFRNKLAGVWGTWNKIFHTGNWYLGTDKQHTVAAATGTVTLNLASASIFDLTLTGNVTLTVSNASVPAGETRSVVVRIRQGVTAQTLTWWSGITWLASTTPAAPAVNKIKEYVLSYDGSSWLGREGASN